MKFALLVSLISLASAAHAVELTRIVIAEPGTHVVTLQAPERCMPSNFALVQKSIGHVFDETGEASSNYRAKLSYITTGPVMAMCRRGSNVARGVIVTIEKNAELIVEANDGLERSFGQGLEISMTRIQ
jgi:hypothetical protein